MRRALIALLLCLFAGEAFAACSPDCYWVQTVTGSDTWDSTTTTMTNAHWAASSNGTAAGPPVAGDNLHFDANSCQGAITCTIVPSGTLTGISFGDLDMRECPTTKCVFTNTSTNLTFARMRFDGSQSPTFTCGSATYTLTNTSGAVFNNGNGHGSISCASATLDVSTVSSPTATRVLEFGGVSIGPLLLAGSATLSGGYGIVVGSIFFNSTITSITITGPAPVYFGAGVTHTIGSITLSGTSSSGIINLTPDTNTGTVGSNDIATLALTGTSTISWAALHGIKINSTSAGVLVVNNAIDLGLNTSGTGTLTLNLASFGGGGGSHIIGDR